MIAQRLARYLAYSAVLALCLGQTCAPLAENDDAGETLAASEHGEPLASVKNPDNQPAQENQPEPQQTELICDAGGPYTSVCEPDFVIIQLDATGSTPSEEGTLTYEWTTDCPGATFDDNTLATPELTIDTSAECPTECTVTLTIDDGILDPVSCEAGVSILGRLQCDAGGPYEEECQGATTEVALDGTGSLTVEDDATLEYEWSSDCPGAVFDDNTSATPILTLDSSQECTTECTATLVVSDGINEPQTCVTDVIVADTTGPVLEGAPEEEELTLECDQEIPEPPQVTAVDDCDSGEILVEFDETEEGDECLRTLTRTWTAEDACGNTSTATQIITIADTTAPEISIEQDLEIVIECVQDIPEVATATVTDNCDAEIEATFEEVDDEETCPRTITRTWTAVDACDNSASLTQTILVDDTTPPVIELNGEREVTLECGIDEYVEMGAVLVDNCDEPTAATVGGDIVDIGMPGTYVITYDGEDACGNEAEQVTRIVHVVDTTPPEIIVGDMHLLWPPNHKHVALDLGACDIRVVDACAGELDLDELEVAIVSIYSDEPENAKGNGDGNTTDDIVIDEDGRFRLRAERAGSGNGRVYGITFEITDPASGDKVEGTCHVGVPHDQSGALPIDDGPGAGYTVHAED